MATKYTFRENILRVIAVIGLIAVLLLGAWGIIQLAFFIPDFLSGLANGSDTASTTEAIVVHVPSSVTAGQPFPVAWTHEHRDGQYSYALSYSCANGLSAEAPLPTGAAQVVPCDTAFNYINASSTTPLILTLDSKAGTTSVSIKVVATKLSSGEAKLSGSASTSVKPAAKSVTTTTKPTTSTSKPTTTKTTTTKSSTTKYVASGRTTNLYGLPDLQVRILSNPGAVRAGSLVALQFEVANVGTNVSPQNWSFTASLPYSPVYTYQSQGQQALYPGDKIVYTLSYAAAPVAVGVGNAYDPAYGWSYGSSVNGWYYAGGVNPNGYQTSTASVSVDPYGLVAESTKANNYASISYQVY